MIMFMHQGRIAKEGGLYDVSQSTSLQCLVWRWILAVAQVLAHSHWARRVGRQWQQAGTPLQHSREIAGGLAETSSRLTEWLLYFKAYRQERPQPRQQSCLERNARAPDKQSRWCQGCSS